MNPETLNLICELAAQLGTTADYLIEIFVRRVLAIAVCGLFVSGALPVLGWGLVKRAERATGIDSHVAVFFAYLALAVAVVVVSIGLATQSIAALASPEAAALKSILEAIKP